MNTVDPAQNGTADPKNQAQKSAEFFQTELIQSRTAFIFPEEALLLNSGYHFPLNFQFFQPVRNKHPQHTEIKP